LREKGGFYMRARTMILFGLLIGLSLGTADLAAQDSSSEEANQAFDNLKQSVGKAQSIIQALNESLKKGIQGADLVEKEFSEFENQLKNLSTSLSDDSDTMKDLVKYREIAAGYKDNAQKQIDEVQSAKDKKFWMKIYEEWENRIRMYEDLREMVTKQRDVLNDKIVWVGESKDKLKQLRLLNLDDEITKHMSELGQELESINQDLSELNQAIPDVSGTPAG
jgi:chromosome segregation ATPase